MEVFGAFLFPLGYFLFDDSWIDSIPARFDLLLLHFPEQSLEPRLERLRRPCVAFRQAALEDLKASRKGKAIRVETDRRRGLKHQGADDIVRQRQGVHLLDHTRWCLAPQVRGLRRSPRVLVRFLLVKGQLFFPAFVVQRDQL